MRVNLLDYVWKGNSGYSYGYIMITDQMSVEDVSRDPRKKILWGGAVSNWYAARCVLEKAGIPIDAYTSVYERDTVKSKNCTTLGFREVLKNAKDYFFIFVADVNDPFRTREDIKLLQHYGVDEFGIIYSGFTKSFSGKEKLQEAFFSSLYEVFGNISLLNHWNDLENCVRTSLEGAGYWDAPFMWIYQLRKEYDNLTYFEAGPGLGTMSLALKKVMDIDVTWLDIPDREALWSAMKSESMKQLVNKYNIHLREGYLETDEITGSYDIVVLAQVMEHFIFNPVNALTKLRNLLTDRGYLFVSVPEGMKHYNVESFKEMPYPNQLTAEDRERRVQINEFGHFHEYSYEEAMEAFAMSGLEMVRYMLSGEIHHFMLKKA